VRRRRRPGGRGQGGQNQVLSRCRSPSTTLPYQITIVGCVDAAADAYRVLEKKMDMAARVKGRGTG